jgi:tetratricopeptide (TPR) repeat protein
MVVFPRGFFMRRFLAFGIFFLGITTPQFAAGMAMTVLGNGDASDCFHAASMTRLGASGLDSCRKALMVGKLSPADRAATHVNMGIVLNGLQRTDEAIESFGHALDLAPNLPEALLSRGNSHYLRRDYDLALADYEASLDHGIRQESAAHFNRGMAHHKKKNFSEAAIAYRRTLELDPDMERARILLTHLETHVLVGSASAQGRDAAPEATQAP